MAVKGAPALRGFPLALTSFIGRAAEVSKITGMIAEYRLVTVTGPGGVGKTRLAAEVARHVAERFADGVQLVELASVQDGEQVPTALAAVLGARQAPGVPVIESVARLLAARQMLLVVGNGEHVLDAVAQLCAALLAAADDLRILVTSREPVAVPGEARYRLGPLAVPGPEAGQDAGRFAAVALFAERARQADPGFTLTAENSPLAGRLVARLDGMPLAIELAAARAEALGLGQLPQRLDSRFSLLVGGDRTAAARQRSLSATVDWSYQLLTGAEQLAFRRLAIFPGPFVLDAAAVVAGVNAEQAVLRLVDCSLVTPPPTGPDGRMRYLMLETLRAFGRERLADCGDRRFRRRAGIHASISPGDR
jgi:predicted ATPase